MSDKPNLKNGDVVGHIGGFPVVVSDQVPTIKGPIVLAPLLPLTFEVPADAFEPFLEAMENGKAT